MAASNRTKKIWRGVWFAILILMFVAFVGVVWWASRTHWRTYAITASAVPELRLAVDYPDNWRPDTKEFSDSGSMVFKPKPPTGWNRWWIKNILRQPINGSNDTEILIGLEPRTAEDKDIDSAERSSRSVLSQVSNFIRKSSLRRIRHRLGPALDYAMELRQTTPPPSCVRGIAIFPDAMPEYSKVALVIEGGTTPDKLPRLESVIEDIAQRIRLLPAGKLVGFQNKHRS